VTIDALLDGLDGIRETGHGKYVARCPAHDDRNPSLSVSDKNGKILVMCWAGCTQEEVIGALRGMGLWHSASRHQLEIRKGTELKNDIRHHQQMIFLGAASTIELSGADIAQMKESMAFLKEHAHG